MVHEYDPTTVRVALTPLGELREAKKKLQEGFDRLNEKDDQEDAQDEGYGTTELSPWASVDVPVHRTLSAAEVADKLGTVGRPVPGVQLRIIVPETRAEVPAGAQELLEVRGANVMLGYLNQPEKTAEVIRDGWYDTGDFASVDEDEFITITGRQHRFSKIGGEMVLHAAVEDAIASLLDSNMVDEKRQVTVNASRVQVS